MIASGNVAPTGHADGLAGAQDAPKTVDTAYTLVTGSSISITASSFDRGTGAATGKTASRKRELAESIPEATSRNKLSHVNPSGGGFGLVVNDSERGRWSRDEQLSEDAPESGEDDVRDGEALGRSREPWEEVVEKAVPDPSAAPSKFVTPVVAQVRFVPHCRIAEALAAWACHCDGVCLPL